MDERLVVAQDLEARLKKCRELSELYQSRERIFGVPVSEYPALDGTTHIFWKHDAKA